MLHLLRRKDLQTGEERANNLRFHGYTQLVTQFLSVTGQGDVMDSVVQQLSDALALEFADLKDIGEFTRITVRLLMAAVLGGVLGFEREQRGKAAGIRTHMLVAIGAAIFVLIPQEAGISDVELSRVMQGVITGVGFLGAGAIIKGNGEKELKGLTTAAGIWLTAAIGICAGLGRETTAILCTFLALMVLFMMPKIIDPLGGTKKRRRDDDAD